MMTIKERLQYLKQKKSQSVDAMEQDCKRAIKQIDEKMYVNEFEDAYDEVLCYGISFYKKRCFVEKK